ncbi:hypothetical protein D3C72_2106830 [compost metagenome]
MLGHGGQCRVAGGAKSTAQLGVARDVFVLFQQFAHGVEGGDQARACGLVLLVDGAERRLGLAHLQAKGRLVQHVVLGFFKGLAQGGREGGHSLIAASAFWVSAGGVFH